MKNIEHTRLQTQTLAALNKTLKPSATFTELFGDKNQIAADTVAYFKQKMDEANTGMDSYNQAIQKGVDQFNELVTSTELGVVTTDKYRQALIQSVGAHVGVQNATKMTTSQLELNQKALLGDVDAINSLNEAHKKLVEEFKKKIEKGVEAFSVAIGVKDNSNKIFDDIIDNIKKKFRKPIKTALQIRGDVKVALPNFNAALQTASTLSEKQADAIVKGIIKTIDEKFKGKKGPFAGLRAILETTVKDTDTVRILNENFMKGDYTASR